MRQICIVIEIRIRDAPPTLEMKKPLYKQKNGNGGTRTAQGAVGMRVALRGI